ncbi:MAG: hypothetical protein M1828_007648 [Chrysothrix sp. TS-e1954]|nr:MAG: hypothetical protein M1828_007648 [Chrysothrix sp. TS-e1954]
MTNELTPRSKIEAMLQAIDDGSDKENSSEARKRCTSAPNSPSKRQRAGPEQRKAAMPFKDASESDSDGPMPNRPRGGMAGRMLGSAREQEKALHSSSSESDGNAYARVKRQLMEKRDERVNLAPMQSEQQEHERSSITQPRVSADSEDELSRPLQQSYSRSPSRRALRISASPRSNDSKRSRNAPSQSQSSRLPVSPSKSERNPETSDAPHGLHPDSDEAPLPQQSRLQELLKRKRDERLSKERAAHHSSSEDDMPTSTNTKVKPRTQIVVHSEDDEDRDAARRLTREARPTRKASKKALQELNRETQRMNRNMQLAHEARTKKKFTTAEFFKKMNFRQPVASEALPQPELNTSSSAPQTSEAEALAQVNTPPSSPPSLHGSTRKACSDTQQEILTSEDELPSLEDMIAKNRASQVPAASGTNSPGHDGTKRASIRKFAKSTKSKQTSRDSEDDLEILPPQKASRLAVLDQPPKSKAQDSRSLQVLRALAHLNSGNDKKARKSMTPAELTAMLQRKGREQALIEKNEKIEALRAKGVIVQTEEERQHDQMRLENMLERARQEARLLAKREKNEAKTEGEMGEHMIDSGDEDEDFRPSDEEGGVELSGSEDEGKAAAASKSDHDQNGDDEEVEEQTDDEEEEDDEEDDEEPNPPGKPKHAMFDDIADESDADDENEEEQDEEDLDRFLDDSAEVQKPRTGARRRTVVISDDEDEDEPTQNVQPKTPSARVFTTPRSNKAELFGFDSVKSKALGLSQVFAGTMAETQAETQAENTAEIADTQRDAVAFLPGLGDEFAGEREGYLVQDSQSMPSGQQRSRHSPEPQTQTQSQTPHPQTQMSELPLPSPDVGFQTAFSPAKIPAGTHETVDTVMLSNQSPIVQRKGRLQRGRAAANQQETSAIAVHATPDDSPSQVDERVPENDQDDEEFAISANAFDVMKRAVSTRPIQQAFNKKFSRANDMIEEHAEESDDEYAGLGGASDDESQGELDEETKKIIDDESHEQLNERQMAAYHADKERVADGKLVSRLANDALNGGFRKRNRAGGDLLESDDEEEAAQRRRAAKRREFAKMRKAILADEKIGKLAENPKRQAFLTAIEDRLEGDDWMLLEEPESVPLNFGSQSQEQQSSAKVESQVLAEGSANVGKKRKFEDIAKGKENERQAAPHERRETKMTKKTSLVDIRNTLSEIIGQPSESPLDLDAADQDEDVQAAEELPTDHEIAALPTEDSANLPPTPAPETARHRRTAPNPTQAAVIDRMALKRQRSSTSNATSTSRLAFQHPSRSFSTSFKTPSLLRRATANASNTSFTENNNTSTSMSKAGAVGLGGMSNGQQPVKMGGTKKSSVNYYVREEERRKKVREVEGRADEERKRMGRVRRKEGRGLGGLGGGTFG